MSDQAWRPPGSCPASGVCDSPTRNFTGTFKHLRASFKVSLKVCQRRRSKFARGRIYGKQCAQPFGGATLAFEDLSLSLVPFEIPPQGGFSPTQQEPSKMPLFPLAGNSSPEETSPAFCEILRWQSASAFPNAQCPPFKRGAQNGMQDSQMRDRVVFSTEQMQTSAQPQKTAAS